MFQLPRFEPGFIPLQTLAQLVTPNSDDDRRLRRMISNRQSARRSRMRKRNQLEDLNREVDRLGFVNRELANRVYMASKQGLAVERENQRLKLEHVALSRRLDEAHRVLVFRQIVGCGDQRGSCGDMFLGNEHVLLT